MPPNLRQSTPNFESKCPQFWIKIPLIKYLHLILPRIMMWECNIWKIGIESLMMVPQSLLCIQYICGFSLTRLCQMRPQLSLAAPSENGSALAKRTLLARSYSWHDTATEAYMQHNTLISRENQSINTVFSRGWLSNWYRNTLHILQKNGISNRKSS